MYNFCIKVHEQSLALWQAATAKPVSPLEEGGASSSAVIGAGSATIELGADEAACRQTDTEEHESQVPIVNTIHAVPYHRKLKYVRHLVMFTTGVGADIVYQHVPIECERR